MEKMLKEESKIIFEMSKDIRDKDILNLCSSDERFYKIQQKHIWDNLLNPLIQNNNILFNLDKKEGKGIGITSDCEDLNLHSKWDYILFCNCIEHLKNPKKALNKIYDLLKNDGVVIMSSPGIYPLHYDPIDNGLRFPTIKEWLDILQKRFKIIEYNQTKPIEAPKHYGIKYKVYSTIIKCKRCKIY